MNSIILVSFALFATSLAFQPRLGTFGNGRVIAGSNAAKNEFPHQISLRYYGSHICGGSIVNKRWIVTAGHCLVNMEKDLLTVHVGILNVNENAKSYAIAKTVIHPNYQGGVNPNDIALIQLKEDLQFSDSVKAINLPKQGAEPQGTAIISGWGYMENNVLPATLQKSTLNVISYATCAKALTDLLHTSQPLNEKSNVCTGLTHTGACNGDSGGPLIQGKTLIGVVSWGLVPCGNSRAPSVFTKVSSFVDFINQYAN